MCDGMQSISATVLNCKSSYMSIAGVHVPMCRCRVEAMVDTQRASNLHSRYVQCVEHYWQCVEQHWQCVEQHWQCEGVLTVQSTTHPKLNYLPQDVHHKHQTLINWTNYIITLFSCVRPYSLQTLFGALDYLHLSPGGCHRSHTFTSTTDTHIVSTNAFD